MHCAYETEEVKSRCGFNDDILSAENLLKQLYFLSDVLHPVIRLCMTKYVMICR